MTKKKTKSSVSSEDLVAISNPNVPQLSLTKNDILDIIQNNLLKDIDDKIIQLKANKATLFEQYYDDNIESLVKLSEKQLLANLGSIKPDEIVCYFPGHYDIRNMREAFSKANPRLIDIILANSICFLFVVELTILGEKLSVRHNISQKQEISKQKREAFLDSVNTIEKEIQKLNKSKDKISNKSVIKSSMNLAILRGGPGGPDLVKNISDLTSILTKELSNDIPLLS